MIKFGNHGNAKVPDSSVQPWWSCNPGNPGKCDINSILGNSGSPGIPSISLTYASGPCISSLYDTDISLSYGNPGNHEPRR